MRLQGNTAEVELADDLRKLEVGRALLFTGWSKDEIPGPFLRVGAVVRPVERNECGMGIDVRDDAGDVHMVWHDEVVLMDEGPKGDRDGEVME